MAIVAKSFLHNDDKIVGASGDADGTLPEDIQDYVSANIGTADVFVTARVKARVVKLASKDWMAIAIQSTAADN